MSPLFLISFVLSFIAMASGNPVHLNHRVFQLKNENDGAQLLCSLKRNPGKHDIVMVKDDLGADDHCHTWFSACDSNINNDLLNGVNNLGDNNLEFTVCQNGQHGIKTLKYDHLRGIFTVTAITDQSLSDSKRFEDVTAKVQVQNGNKIKIVMEIKSKQTMFLLTQNPMRSSQQNYYGAEHFLRVFHGQIQTDPEHESYFVLRHLNS